jgi:hypothetical protein
MARQSGDCDLVLFNHTPKFCELNGYNRSA